MKSGLPFFQLAVALVLTWGAGAFGSVYPWAYTPLAIAAAACGIWGVMLGGAGSLRPHRPLVLGMAAIAAAIAVQLAPLPMGVIDAISPNTRPLVAQFDLRMLIDGTTRPLSMHPSQTVVSLWLFLSFGVLMAGVAAAASRGAAWRIAVNITVLGTVMALVGIVYRAAYNGKVLGFWTPQFNGNPFGPFVNRNHFAGWMAMALPVALAVFLVERQRARRHARPERLVSRAGSPEAARLTVLLASTYVMALSLVLTMSRSGILSTAIAIGGGTLVFRRHLTANIRSRTMRIGAAIVMIAIAAAIGLGPLLARITGTGWNEVVDRQRAWEDAVSVFARFPVTGTGMNTYGDAMLFFQTHGLDWHFVQAHNDYLELAAEGGLLVLVPVIVTAMLLIAAIRRAFRETPPGSSLALVRAGAVVGLAAIGMQELLDFSLQMPGNAALCAVLAGLAIHMPADQSFVNSKRPQA